MPDLVYGKTAEELVNQGWIIIVDEATNEMVGIRSVIQNWESMTWAERTYYTAKYQFNKDGILDIRLPEQFAKVSSPVVVFRPASDAVIAVPQKKLPGSNDRLRAILSQSRVAVENSRYDDTGLAHIGPDGTAILTNESLWGLPDPQDDSYTYVNERYMCVWEDSDSTWLPEAPWWALGPDGEELH